jgi:hypothetical protein
MRSKMQDFGKRLGITLVVVLVVFSFNSYVLAVVANPEPYDVIQGDGQKINVVQKGDEWNNWIETADGYAIERDESGWWRYSGTMHVKDGGLIVGIDDPTGLVEKHFRKMIREVPSSAKHQRRLNKASASLNHNTLVILVEFSDQSAIGTNASNWANKVFLDPNNSVADYYSEISYGQFTIVPASESHGTSNDGVVGWLNLGYNHPDTRDNTDYRNQQLSRDAILAADPYVNFSSFDSNGDRYISTTELSIIVVAAGYEYSCGSYTPSLWGHKWTLGGDSIRTYLRWSDSWGGIEGALGCAKRWVYADW